MMSIIFDLVCFGCVSYMAYKLIVSVKKFENSYLVLIDKVGKLSKEVEKLKSQINEK